MRKTVMCPKCSERKILYLNRVSDRGDHNIVSPMYLMVKHHVLSVERCGKIEAAVCATCGYTEFYATELGAMPVDGETVRFLEVPPEPPEQGPYR
jgi:predicted nucleic-acid-binding Zn-ribbon protein